MLQAMGTKTVPVLPQALAASGLWTGKQQNVPSWAMVSSMLGRALC